MQQHKIEGNQITLLDQRYYYLGGQFCPSISTILEAYPKDAHFFKWLKENGEDSDRIKEDAGRRGSNVHKMTEDYDDGLEVSLLNDKLHQQWSVAEWAMFTRYVEFRAMTQEDMEIKAVEMRLIDLELREAGTLDRYVILKGKNMILDVKTSNAIYPSYFLQLAAYRRLFERKSGIKIDAVGIVWLNAKTRGPAVNKIQGKNWQLIVREDSSEDLELFECTKRLWLQQNKDVTPQNVSYQLSYKKDEANA
jgi:hypothetical protein